MKGDFAKDLSEFVTHYVALLKALHKQQIIIKDMQHESEQNAKFGHSMHIEGYLKELNEWAERNKLTETINLIDLSFDKIKSSDAEQKLVESLMLK